MPPRVMPIAATAAGAIILLLVFHHAVFQSGFDQVNGDIIDTRFNVAILEHWFRVIQGRDPWLSLNFYYPATGTLGYSDALLLLTPPYLLSRLADVSAFHALQITVLLATITGFAGTLLFLRGVLGLALPVAVTAAVAFAGNTALSQSLGSGHIQLLATMGIPWLACLIVAYLRALRWRRGLPYGAAAGALLGALLYTSFNTGWFIAVQLLVIGVLFSAAALLKRGIRALTGAAKMAMAMWWHWPTLALVTAASLTPFLLTYLPVVTATGGRTYQEVAISLPQPIDLIHPLSNLIWDPIVTALIPALAGHTGELGKGLTGGLLAVFAATLVWLLLRRHPRFRGGLQPPPGSDRTRLQHRVAGVLGLSVLVCWSLMVEIDHVSLWAWVYRIIPGAIGVRAVFRFNLILVFSVMVVAAIGLHLAWTAGTGRIRRTLVTLLGLMIAAEQINAFDNRLSQRQHFAPLTTLPPAPAQCRSFVLFPAFTDPDRPRFAYQTDAITLAQHHNLPTVNGYSGMAPPFWSLADPADRIGYGVGLIDWTDRNALWTGLCAADLGRRAWVPLTRADLIRRAGLTLSPDSRLSFTTADDSGRRFLKPGPGWGGAELGGTWTTARSARLEGVLTGWPPGGVRLEMLTSAFLAPQHPTQTVVVVVNGTVVSRFGYRLGDALPNRQSITVPASALPPSGAFVLDFLIDDARSPASLGLASDTRDLGLLLTRLSFQPDAP